MKDFLLDVVGVKGVWPRMKFNILQGVSILIYILAVYVDYFIYYGSEVELPEGHMFYLISTIITGILIVLGLIYLIPASIKRLRDIGYNPWLAILNLVPVANFVMWIILTFRASKVQETQVEEVKNQENTTEVL